MARVNMLLLQCFPLPKLVERCCRKPQQTIIMLQCQALALIKLIIGPPSTSISTYPVIQQLRIIAALLHDMHEYYQLCIIRDIMYNDSVISGCEQLPSARCRC